MKDILSKLTCLKIILALLFCITTCVLVLKGQIATETFMTLTMAIITYFFTKDAKGE